MKKTFLLFLLLLTLILHAGDISWIGVNTIHERFNQTLSVNRYVIINDSCRSGIFVFYRLSHKVDPTDSMTTVFRNRWYERFASPYNTYISNYALKTYADSIGNSSAWIHNTNKTILRNINDKVGIGTNTPDSTLTVIGSGRFSKNIKVNGITVGSGVATYGGSTILGTSVKDPVGPYNTYIGFYSGNSSTGGAYNTGVGPYTFQYNTTGRYNIAVGHQALWSNRTGNGNTAIGYAAGTNYSGNANTAIGYWSMISSHAGENNTAIGYWSLKSLYNGSNNIGIGYGSLYNLINANHNIGIGYYALFEHLTGEENTAIGDQALYSLSNGTGNTALGYNACVGGRSGSNPNFNGSYNTVVGHRAVNEITTGSGNTVMGNAACLEIQTGSYNIFVGDSAGTVWPYVSMISGNYNIGIGKYSLSQPNGSSNNIAIGLRAGKLHSSGNGNIYIGDSAGSVYTTETGKAYLFAKDSTSNGIIFDKYKGYGNWNGAFLSKDTLGSGWTLSNLSTGSTMLWYPKKASFRVGFIDTPSWNNDSTGVGSIGLGINPKAKGLGAVSFSNGNASGDYSFAGSDGKSPGYESFSWGNCIANSSYGIAIGNWNIGGGNPFSGAWIATDPLFEIGNGTSTGAKSNALTVYKNGNTIISGTVTVPALIITPSDTTGYGIPANVGMLKYQSSNDSLYVFKKDHYWHQIKTD